MSDFSTIKIVKAAKSHLCEHCRKPILKGDDHRRTAGVFEGDFYTYREHPECHQAWDCLNFSSECRNLDYYDGAPFLCDDENEPEDKKWMVENHPIVAARLGWSAA